MNHEMTPEVRQQVMEWIVQSAFGLVAFGLLLFLSAGRFDWFWGWVLLGVLAAFLAAHPLILIPINPEAGRFHLSDLGGFWLFR
jgi:hypothetical protein